MKVTNQILYTALVTPFDKNGENIDYESLEKLLTYQNNAKNGILLLGSTGESLSLSFKEKQEIINFACNLKLKTEIIVGVPSYNLEIAIEWIDFCNQMAVNGYLMTTPIYTKAGEIGQTKWFEKLLDRAKHSSILYNIPGRSGIKLNSQAVKNLSSHDKFVAIKDSGGSIENMYEYKISAPNIAIYCGDDYMTNSMISEGAIGLISVSSNAWPKAIKKYVQNAILQNKENEKNNTHFYQAFQSLFKASNPIPIKSLLKEIQLIHCNNTRPPLSSDDFKFLNELLVCHEILNELED